MSARAVVALPWRPGPGRQRCHDYVRGWLGEHFPELPVVEVDTDHDPYNLAAARNLGVRRAEQMGADVAVLLDADTVLQPPRVLAEAIDAAATSGALHLPFDRLRYLTETETDQLLAGRGVATAGTAANGGAYVVAPATYWQAGGSDERFSGWGGDDDGLVAAAHTLAGLVRHRAWALTLWHPACRDIGSDRHRPNAELAARYWSAIGDPAAMRSLIAERAGC